MEKSIYDDFYQLEEKHWWFVVRREIILDFIKKIINKKNKKEVRILDIGCGTGLMLEFLEKFGRITGLDNSAEAVEYSNKRGGNKVIVKGDISEWDSKDKFDLILALDVIEHIDDDEKALKKIYGLMEEDGIFLCTVPAFSFLWSGHDEVNHHKRRYARRELYQKLLSVGFKVEKISYFNTFLFPPVLAVRLIKRLRKSVESESDMKMPLLTINKVLLYIFSLERFFLSRLNFPFGVSILAIAKK
ncbi:MAG: class I SAM-dependent methyltransferase [Actinobacteria bacterium]|nr:class I SAM-dependent methyltransferase [Actinomycetota bacterium]